MYFYVLENKLRSQYYLWKTHDESSAYQGANKSIIQNLLKDKNHFEYMSIYVNAGIQGTQNTCRI